MLVRVLIASGCGKTRRRLQTMLAPWDVVASCLSTKTELLQACGTESLDVIAVDAAFLTGGSGDDVELLTSLPEKPEIVVLLERDDPAESAYFVGAGARAVLDRQLPVRALREALQSIVAGRRQWLAHNVARRQKVREPSLDDFVSDSPAMQAFLALARRVARSDASILITGETGVGKERLARAIHGAGQRAQQPFVAVNCGALPEALLESELFGHDEGAFTGATRSRRGVFELAHRGTVFLDEIGEMPVHLQVKLLRALQEGEIKRLGGERTLAVDVRVLAATNRDLEADIEVGRFRRDLFYRINVVHLDLPALRDRQEDIPELAINTLEHMAATMGSEVGTMSDPAMAAMCAYSWPGNVRELINVIERAVLVCESDTITLADLPFGPPNAVGRAVRTCSQDCLPLPADWREWTWRAVRERVVAEAERRYLVEVLTQTRGRMKRAAATAGMSSRALLAKMRTHGLDKSAFRGSSVDG